MDAQIEAHLPLITQRITFAPKAFPPSAVITARMEFPAIVIKQYDFTPPVTPVPKNSVIFDIDVDMDRLSPLTDSEPESDDLGNQNDLGAQNGKIKKPRGGPGRPGGKGYNLQAELGWNDQTYESLVLLVHKLAKERLDLTKSFRSQDKKELRRISERVTKEHSFLQDYENVWPIRDILISRLKYTSESARRKDAQKKTKQMEKILTRSSGNINN